jgi:predicted nucleic acid-binding protein
MSIFIDTGVLYAHHDTDAVIVALCELRGIDAVLSFDTDFDGVVDRTDG